VLAIADGDEVQAGQPIAKPERRTKGKTDMPSPVSGKVTVSGTHITIAMKDIDEEEVPAVPAEELSLEDLDDDEDEEGAEEGLEDLEDITEPTLADLTKPAE
jgi:Na+-translocating ferredoxin:NAD+ oxidoreductase RnfC subunit